MSWYETWDCCWCRRPWSSQALHAPVAIIGNLWVYQFKRTGYYQNLPQSTLSLTGECFPRLTSAAIQNMGVTLLGKGTHHQIPLPLLSEISETSQLSENYLPYDLARKNTKRFQQHKEAEDDYAAEIPESLSGLWIIYWTLFSDDWRIIVMRNEHIGKVHIFILLHISLDIAIIWHSLR